MSFQRGISGVFPIKTSTCFADELKLLSKPSGLLDSSDNV
jgi:hypothetical protein